MLKKIIYDYVSVSNLNRPTLKPKLPRLSISGRPYCVNEQPEDARNATQRYAIKISTMLHLLHADFLLKLIVQTKRITFKFFTTFIFNYVFNYLHPYVNRNVVLCDADGIHTVPANIVECFSKDFSNYLSVSIMGSDSLSDRKLTAEQKHRDVSVILSYFNIDEFLVRRALRDQRSSWP